MSNVETRESGIYVLGTNQKVDAEQALEAIHGGQDVVLVNISLEDAFAGSSVDYRNR